MVGWRGVSWTRVGNGVLALSAAGFPATQYVIRRFGRPGAAVVELVCVGLLARDAVMLAQGTPRVLRKGPAALLWLECAVAAVASASNVRLLLRNEAGECVAGRPGDALESIRRGAVAALFGLHTVRFQIYLRPDQGRR